MAFETPALKRAKEEIAFKFYRQVAWFGTYNRRPIARSSTWSQHSWPNALDIHVGSQDDGDMIFAWIKDNWDRLQIRTALWWVKDHYDHIHIDFWPRGYSTPSRTRGGSDNRYKTATGEILTQEQLEEDVTELVAALQSSLAVAGFDPGPVDGVLGDQTKAALLEAFSAAAQDKKARKLAKDALGKLDAIKEAIT